MRLSDIRRDYALGSLNRENLDTDPIVQFDIWFKEAIAAQLPDSTAMTLATVDKEGKPFQRIVLLKDVTPKGFVFYTNLASRKAEQIKHNAKVSLHFPWHVLERQVHISGIATRLTIDEDMRYFMSRPKESQLAAWASKQSQRVSTRQILESKYQELKKAFENKKIPVPSFWGGYCVQMESIEFWQGGKHRLHDRFIYVPKEGKWKIERLCP